MCIRDRSDLPPALSERYSIVQPATEGHESMRAWGSRYARLVLERCKNNKRQACRVLDISYHTLQAYLRYKPKLKARRNVGHGDPPALAEPGGEPLVDEATGGESSPIDASPMEATLVAE